MWSQSKYKIKKTSSGDCMFENEKVDHSLFFTLEFVKHEGLLIVTAQGLQILLDTPVIMQLNDNIPINTTRDMCQVIHCRNFFFLNDWNV